jgi:hypothetical protein
MGHTVKRYIQESFQITQYIGEEVFIVAGSEDEETSEIKAFGTWGDLVEYLKTLTPTSDPETRVFHGVLTPGEFLPNSFRGKSAYVICLDPYESSNGCIVESGSENPEGLAEEISSVMKLGGPLSDMRTDIDDIYILYGYQLEICLSINDDDLDEEVISTCKEIADEVEISRIIIKNV